MAELRLLSVTNINDPRQLVRRVRILDQKVCGPLLRLLVEVLPVEGVQVFILGCRDIQPGVPVRPKVLLVFGGWAPVEGVLGSLFRAALDSESHHLWFAATFLLILHFPPAIPLQNRQSCPAIHLG